MKQPWGWQLLVILFGTVAMVGSVAASVQVHPALGLFVVSVWAAYLAWSCSQQGRRLL